MTDLKGDDTSETNPVEDEELEEAAGGQILPEPNRGPIVAPIFGVPEPNLDGMPLRGGYDGTAFA